MATYTKHFLSESTNGAALFVDPGQFMIGMLVHTAHTTSIDEVWLYASLRSGATLNSRVDVGIGEDTASYVITPESGLILVIPGLIVSSGVAIRVRDGLAQGDMFVTGYVNRITP